MRARSACATFSDTVVAPSMVWPVSPPMSLSNGTESCVVMTVSNCPVTFDMDPQSPASPRVLVPTPILNCQPGSGVHVPWFPAASVVGMIACPALYGEEGPTGLSASSCRSSRLRFWLMSPNVGHTRATKVTLLGNTGMGPGPGSLYCSVTTPGP